jgi:hypothetical protein
MEMAEKKTCPSTEQRNIALQKVKDNVYQYLFNGTYGSIFHSVEKGYGIKLPIATYLNMTDSSQQCPSAWRPYSGNLYRACGRPDSRIISPAYCKNYYTKKIQSSPATFYTTNCQYVEELLLYNLQVPMDFIHLIIILTVSTWMELALPMDRLVTISGPLLVHTVRRLQVQKVQN